MCVWRDSAMVFLLATLGLRLSGWFNDIFWRSEDYSHNDSDAIAKPQCHRRHTQTQYCIRYDMFAASSFAIEVASSRLDWHRIPIGFDRIQWTVLCVSVLVIGCAWSTLVRHILVCILIVCVCALDAFVVASQSLKAKLNVCSVWIVISWHMQWICLYI